MRSPLDKEKSVLKQAGLEAGIKTVLEQIISMYEADSIPWVVGYSGGKDSTAVLQLVWTALAQIEPSKRTKDVHVISTDTLVENPIVATWVNLSLRKLSIAAREAGLPIKPHRLTPDIRNTYFVNLIGRGYPAPRPKFRWCTTRLKIEPANRFIHSVVKSHGEAIVVLGTRKAESKARANVMNRLEKDAVRERLRPHTMLPNSYVYSPIESWSNDDVWMLLMQKKNPWGHNNKDLLTMYQGASPDGECPLVIDSTTPSCGDSRFGCWVCTLVEQDKSMTAMIQNDQEREWMLPLLKLRDELIPRSHDGFPADRHLRDFRRMHGGVQLMTTNDQHIPGPYVQGIREMWLKRVLEAQVQVQKFGPEDMRDLELITVPELREIRRIWVNEKHEIEDSLPALYESVTGKTFPDSDFTEDLPIGRVEIGILRDLCDKDDLHFQLTRELLSVERQHRHLVRRKGLFSELENAFERNFYNDIEDATDRAKRLRDRVASEVGNVQSEPYIRTVDDDGSSVADGEN